MSTTTAPTKTLAAKAFRDELGRRSKPRNQRGRMKSWIFSAMGRDDIKRVLDGETVEVNFKSGRTEHIAAR